MKVSVIVPVYNIERYICGCVESLTNQTYPDIEIILVDDGSTDGSLEVCREIKKTDDRIKVIHKENGGLSSARNAGLDIATGKFVMFIDGDDYLVENAIELLINIQNKFNSDIVQFDYEETENTYYAKADNELPKPLYVNKTRDMFDKLYELGGSCASACTKIYKKAIFDNLRFKEGIFHEDEQIIPFVLKKANSIVYLKNKLYCYYTRPGSITKSEFNIRKFDILEIISERITFLADLNYIDLINREKQRYFTNLVIFYAEAKKAGNQDACRKLKHMMKKFLKTYKVKLSGYMNIIRILCCVNTGFIATYYWLRRALRKE